MTLLSRPLQRALPLFRLYPSRFPYRLKPTPHARRITTLGKENPAKLPENRKTSVGVALPENKEEWPSIFGEINSYLLTYGHPMSKLKLPQTSVAENGTRQCSDCNATISWKNNAALEFSEEKGIYELSKSHKCAKCDVNQASIFGTMLSTAEDEIDAYEGAYNEGIELSTATAEDDIYFFDLPELTNNAKAPAVDASNPAGSNAAAEVTAVKTNLPKSTTKTKAKTAEKANSVASEKSHKTRGNRALEKNAAAESSKSSRKTKTKSDVEANAASDSPKSSTKAQAIQENAVVNPPSKSKAAPTGTSVDAKAVPNAPKSKKTVTKSKPSIEMEAVRNPPTEITVTSDNSAKAVVDPLLTVSQAKPTTETKKPASKSKAKMIAETKNLVSNVTTSNARTAAKPAVKENIVLNPLQTADSEGKPIVAKTGNGPKSGNNITKAQLSCKANAAADQPMVARRIRMAVLKAPESKNTITATKPALEANATTPNLAKSGKKTEADPTVDAKTVPDALESVTEIAPEAKSATIPIKSIMKQTAVERELSKLERTESESGILNLGNDQLRHIEAMSALKLKHETMRALLESDRPPQDIVYLWNNFFPRT